MMQQSSNNIKGMEGDLGHPQLIPTMACDIYNNMRASEVKKKPSVDSMERFENGISACMEDDQDHPPLIPTMALDIYRNMRASECKNRPAIDYMERVQNGIIDASIRATAIDWLMQIADCYSLVPETMFLAVNYFDRYLSGNVMSCDRLELLGLTCLMIASKHEDPWAPQAKEFRYTAFAKYSKKEILQMESAVVFYLKYELTVPTAKCFLGIFFHAAVGANQVQAYLKLKYLSDYIAELSLLDYTMLRCDPSLVAASAMFLAKFILCPCWSPWNYKLELITLYQPSDLQECVNALHNLYCNSQISSRLSAIRAKYSKVTYEFVAEKWCPSSIPPEFFQNISCDTSKCASAFLELLSALHLK